MHLRPGTRCMKARSGLKRVFLDSISEPDFMSRSVFFCLAGKGRGRGREGGEGGKTAAVGAVSTTVRFAPPCAHYGPSTRSFQPLRVLYTPPHAYHAPFNAYCTIIRSTQRLRVQPTPTNSDPMHCETKSKSSRVWYKLYGGCVEWSLIRDGASGFRARCPLLPTLARARR